MDASRIELYLVLDQLGLSKLKLDTFSERFNVQKRMYLTQIMGYDLGYRFNWYIRGPYSPRLTEEVFALRDDLTAGDQDFNDYQLSPDGLERIRKATALCDIPKGLSIEPNRWLELLASLHYLKHIAYWPDKSERSFTAVFEKLVESKPHFAGARVEAEVAWKQLEAFGLTENSTAA